MVAVLLVQGPSYTVSAKILVQLGREMMPSSVVGARDGTQVMPVSMRPEDSAAEVELLTDPNLVRQTVESFGADFFLGRQPATTIVQKIKQFAHDVVDTAKDSVRGVGVMLGLRPSTTPLQRVTLAVESGLAVEPVRKSDVISLTLTFPDPEAGVAILDRFISVAMENHLKAHHAQGERALFATQREERNQELKLAQRHLLAILNEKYAAWLAPEQRTVLLKTIADLQLQRAQSLADSAQSVAEIDNIQTQLLQLPKDTQTSRVQTRNKIADDLQGRLVQLRLDLQTLLTHYAPESPDVADLQRQIDTIGTALASQAPFQVSELTNGVSQQYDAISQRLLNQQNELAGQRARVAQMDIQLDEFHQQLRSVQAAGIEVDQLERDITRLHRLIDRYDDGIDDAHISEAMEAADLSNLRVIMPPTADLMPSGPSLKRALLIGIAGGLLVGLAAVLLPEYLRPLRRVRVGDNDTAGKRDETGRTAPTLATASSGR